MTEATAPNFPELKRLNLWVQAQSKLEPGAREWQQKWWVTLREKQPMCKTAYCVAGAAVVRAGHKLEIKIDSYGEENTMLDGHLTGGDAVINTANEILGINREISGDLYLEYNEAEDIDWIIKKIFADHDVSYTKTKAAPNKKIVIVESD